MEAESLRDRKIKMMCRLSASLPQPSLFQRTTRTCPLPPKQEAITITLSPSPFPKKVGCHPWETAGEGRKGGLWRVAIAEVEVAPTEEEPRPDYAQVVLP